MNSHGRTPALNASSMSKRALRLVAIALFAIATTGCPPGSLTDAGGDARTEDVRRDGDAASRPDTGDAGARVDASDVPRVRTPGYEMWESTVQPAIAAQCAPCHMGQRFAFASLQRAGTAFTADETATNYETFIDLIAIDVPSRSRLLAKPLPVDHPDSTRHAGGPRIAFNDATYNTLLTWIRQEKADRCPTCGTSAPVQYIAYVDQPALSWAMEPDPIRSDHGLRERARIMLRRLDPATLRTMGDPIDFLGSSFCGADGRCDFNALTVNHAGDKMAFGCRLSLTPADWVNDVRWNVCIADIGPDGRAVNPRFLLAPHRGRTIARSDPFGLTSATGVPLIGAYDQHFQTRRRDDRDPVFSPDDRRVYLSSKRPDPRSGVDGTTTYHGFNLTNNIISVNVDGSDPRTIYYNEGGEADVPFFRRNGNIVFHTWNLERMDRHLYTQATADGMMEIPVFFGRVQGPNMWGRATELANGTIIGMTGRRRSSIQNYVPFLADHTLGTGIDTGTQGFQIFDQRVFEQVIDFPTGYCNMPPDGPSCVIDRYYADPAYAPDGRAFIAHNPERTYVSQGEAMFLGYARGSNQAEQIASMLPYVPHRMGISLIDHRGALERVVDPADGRMLTNPVWVGRSAPPRVQPSTVDESMHTADMHIADVPVWFSFRHSGDSVDKRGHMQGLDTIVAVRVLSKDMEGNACLNDNRPYRFAVNAGSHDHPTHLGINNSTGYRRYIVPAAQGGDAFGDVPLQADHSVSLRLPAGELLLIQGINALGHTVVQQSRIFSLPPGRTVNTAVRRTQYYSQCASCHGIIEGTAPFVGLANVDRVAPVTMDFATLAAARPPVDLSAPTVSQRRMTFLHTVRPLFDRACVSCHSGAAPAGQLSLSAQYSRTANFPAGRWATTPGLFDPNYVASVPAANRVPGYDYSVTYAWLFHEDETPYRTSSQFAPLIASQAPIANLAPWDPAYQNLFANEGARFRYLTGENDPNFGRSDRFGGYSSASWLIEILTGRNLSPLTFTGPDHTRFLSDNEVRDIIGVIDTGFVYMGRCDDRTIASGPHMGQPWGDPHEQVAR